MLHLKPILFKVRINLTTAGVDETFQPKNSVILRSLVSSRSLSSERAGRRGCQNQKSLVVPKIADRTTRRVLSRFTPGAPERSILFIINQKDGWHRTLGAAGGPRTTPPLGCNRYGDNLLQDQALPLDDNSLSACMKNLGQAGKLNNGQNYPLLPGMRRCFWLLLCACRKNTLCLSGRVEKNGADTKRSSFSRKLLAQDKA